MKYKIRPAIFKYIEAELQDYNNTLKLFQQQQEEIIHNKQVIENKGSFTGNTSNTTQNKAIQLITNKRLVHLEKTIRDIDNVLSRLDKDRYKLVDLWYWQRRLTPFGIAGRLNISEATAYRWRKEVIELLGVEMGLVNPVDLV